MKFLPIKPELLEKYLAGKCSPEEKREVEDWYFELDKGAPAFRDNVPEFDKVELFEKIRAQIDDDEIAEPKASARVFSLSKANRIFIGIAALFVLVLGVKYLTPNINDGASAPMAAKADHIELNNNTSATVAKKLPDGSTVWLKPGANLVYERKNEASVRAVRFKGEAFFDVERDTLHPFIISAEEMQIKVLGTSFNVIALPNNKVFKVSVVTGKVKVTAKNKAGIKESVYLTPKEQASYSLSSRKIVQSLLTETQLKKQFWKPFSLSFGDAEMGMVAEELEKAFQVKVRFSDPSIADCHLRVDFNNLQLPEIMSLLEMLLDVNCELIDGDIVQITGKGCTD